MLKTWFQYIKNRGYKAFIILFIVFVIIFFCVKFFIIKDDAEIVLLADRMKKSDAVKRKIELIKVNLSGNAKPLSKTDIVFLYPQTPGNLSHFCDPSYNLLKDSNNDSYCLYNILYGAGFYITVVYKLEYFSLIKKAIVTDKMRVKTIHGYRTNLNYADIDLKNKFIFLNNGGCRDLKSSQKRSRNYYRIKNIDTSKCDESFEQDFNIWSKILPDGSVLQISIKYNKEKSGLERESTVLRVLPSEVGKYKYLNFGFNYQYKKDFISDPSITLSPSGKQVCFLTLLPEDGKMEYYCWLCIWDFSKEKVHKIVKMKKWQEYPNGYSHLLWNPNSSNSIIAFFLSEQYFLIDYQQKKITKTFKAGKDLKSMRWSPDGNRLGIMDYDGSFYIYDMKKNKVEFITKDKDYFDFFWIPEK